MWVPENETELRVAVEDGSLEETAAFDAKAQLPQPGKNKDLAKDICAMTVEGGVLIYGLGGDDPSRPDTLMPIELAGAAERIDLVAQSGVREAPYIKTRSLPLADDSARGYVVVEVPQSPRSPHMLILGDDNRYWGRGATGNRRLSEGEVARLYERRERWEVDRDALLDEEIEAMPFSFLEPVEESGPMVVMARPVGGRANLLHIAAGGGSPRDFFQRELQRKGGEVDPYPQQGSSGIESVYDVQPKGAGRWIFRRDRDLGRRYQAYVELAADGGVTYWHSPTVKKLERDGEVSLLMEQSVTRAVHQALASAGFIYGLGGHHGAVDVAVAVLAIGDATAASGHGAMWGQEKFGADEFRSTIRVAAASQLVEPKSVIRELLQPLFEAFSVSGYDPYAASRFPDSEPE